jgi:hypothetical protein
MAQGDASLGQLQHYIDVAEAEVAAQAWSSPTGHEILAVAVWICSAIPITMS